MKVVMAFGCFDPLHKGHLEYFKQAKSYGDKLIVIVARDSSIIETKKRSANKEEKHRVKQVEKVVNKVILGHPKDKMYWIKKLKPDVLVLGYDQKPRIPYLKRKLLKLGIKAKVVRAKPYKPGEFKSSNFRSP
jgi:FAD synthetase